MLPFIMSQIYFICNNIVRTIQIYETFDETCENEYSNKTTFTDELKIDVVKLESISKQEEQKPKINLIPSKKNHYQNYNQTVDQDSIQLLTIEELSKKLKIIIKENSDGSLSITQPYYKNNRELDTNT